MKKLLFTLTALTLLLCTTVGVGAAFLGGAAPVLAEDVTLIKTGLRGENIKFSDTDFKEALAVPDFSSVTVESLPKSTEGTSSPGAESASGRRSNERTSPRSLSSPPQKM